MRVLITGVSSFVGYHLAVGFQAAGHEVTGVVGSAGARAGISGERLVGLREKGISLYPLDLTDPVKVAECVEVLRPEAWLQHAGYTKNYASADFDLRAGLAVNALPLPAIFSAMAGVGGAVIVTGTVAEYGDAEEPHVEGEAGAPALPYGLSKLAGTLLAQQLAARLGVPTRVARLFLPFGPMDAPAKLLGATVTALQAGEAVRLSPCLQRRDFLLVDDVVDFYLRLIPDLPRSPYEIYNVCGGESPALREVLLEFAAVLGADPALCEFGAIPMRPGEPLVVAGSNEKARRWLGWKPTPWREAVGRFLAPA